MRYFFFLLLILSTQINSKQQAVLAKEQQEAPACLNWKKNKVLETTRKKAARTAVLIICPPKFEDDYNNCRWKLGQKVWQQYMNRHANVDCYFLQSADPREGTAAQVWCEGNTLFVGDPAYTSDGQDRILHKTIAAIEALLPKYTHFMRTNLNTFININMLNNYVETHRQSMFTGPLWQDTWYVIGYGLLFTADVAAHMVKEYRRLEGSAEVRWELPDDSVLTSLATGVNLLDPPEGDFTCCPSLTPGVRQLMCKRSFSSIRLKRYRGKYGVMLLPPISVDSATHYIDQAPKTTILYRVREGFDLVELAKVYEHLLHKVYPKLSNSYLVDYASSLPAIRPPVTSAEKF